MTQEVETLLTQGGDARIGLDPETGRNRYHSAPRPSDALAYASSTANDISRAAFRHVRSVLDEIGADPSPDVYARRLEALRARIRAAYGVDEDVAIVFAPSGTDLEYVALACVDGLAPEGISNILLGADEVGSGCIYSAYGQYFAGETALGHPTRAGDPVPGLGGAGVGLIDIPVRDAGGRVRTSADIAAKMEAAIAAATADRRHSLVHVVHGSKTGLILPHLADLDERQARHGADLTLVVDACQARITAAAVADYLARGAILFVTGSKFMGAPPFSGFALVPQALEQGAAPLPSGFATIFRRAEWPADWPGVEQLPDGVNLGLLLRLEAAIFELERFQALADADVERVILAFHAAVRAEIVEQLPIRRVAPYPPGESEEADTHPVEMRTLSTLDLSAIGGGASFEDAQRWYKAMVGRGVRLGQPVKCVHLPDGAWGATLRIGLAMWQIADRAMMPDDALAAAFAADMTRIREAISAVALDDQPMAAGAEAAPA